MIPFSVKLKSKTFLLFLLSVILLSVQSCSNRAELKKRGIKTTAVVVDGVSEQKRKFINYKLKIKFKLENGEEITTEKDVTASTFDMVYKDCEIAIIYLPDDPTEFDIIISDEDVKYYLGIENRPLFINDFYAIYNEPNLDSVTSYLNTVSAKWKRRDVGSRIYWENQTKKEFVAMSHDTLTYATYSDLWNNKFSQEITKANYVKTYSDSTGLSIYENDNFRIAYSYNFNADERNVVFQLCHAINMVKK